MNPNTATEYRNLPLNVLTESLEVIQKAAAVILSALENPVTEEPTAEPETGGQPQDN